MPSIKCLNCGQQSPAHSQECHSCQIPLAGNSVEIQETDHATPPGHKTDRQPGSLCWNCGAAVTKNEAECHACNIDLNNRPDDKIRAISPSTRFRQNGLKSWAL